MNFTLNTPIVDAQGECRWQVERPLETLTNLRFWEVRDQTSALAQRKLRLMTLDYSNLPANDRDFAIQQLRDSLRRMIQTLSEGNYTFLPEPVDLMTFGNHIDPMDTKLRAHELGLVYAQSDGDKLKPVRNEKGVINTGLLGKMIRATLKMLAQLHRNQVVIQALPRTQIRLNAVTYQPYFVGIQTLIKMDDFQGFNQNRAGLTPSVVFAAPESFDPRGRLTPATDIYALGKLALQLLLGTEFVNYFTPQAPFPDNVQNIINQLNLPAPWPRFLATCLQKDPKQRFQSAFEAEQFLLSPERQKVIQQQRAAATAPRTQTPTHSGQTAAPAQKWIYRENPQLPDAMLLVWGERLTSKDQQFNFIKLYSDYQNSYNLRPRLFFQTQHTGTVNDNPFFVMLQNQFKFTVIPLQQNPVGVLHHALDPHLSTLRNVIVVGGADEAGVQSLLQHPHAGKWRIHWVRGAGNWNPTTRVETVTNLANYLRVKKREYSAAASNCAALE